MNLHDVPVRQVRRAAPAPWGESWITNDMIRNATETIGRNAAEWERTYLTNVLAEGPHAVYIGRPAPRPDRTDRIREAGDLYRQLMMEAYELRRGRAEREPHVALVITRQQLYLLNTYCESFWRANLGGLQDRISGIRLVVSDE